MTISVLVLFLLIFIGKGSYSSLIDNSNGFGNSTIFGFISGIISGLLIFLFSDLFRRSRDKETERKKTRDALKIEIKQNLQFVNQSIHIPLSNDAWNEAIRNGQSIYLENELQQKLISLYSKISDRNCLTRAFLSNTNLQVYDSNLQNPVPATTVIISLTNEIKNESETIIAYL